MREKEFNSDLRDYDEARDKLAHFSENASEDEIN